MYILKTDVILTASFPEYLVRILPRESKGYVAQSLSTKPITGESEEQTEKIPTITEESTFETSEPADSMGMNLPNVSADIKSAFLGQEFEDEYAPENQKRISEQFKYLLDESDDDK